MITTLQSSQQKISPKMPISFCSETLIQLSPDAEIFFTNIYSINVTLFGLVTILFGLGLMTIKTNIRFASLFVGFLTVSLGLLLLTTIYASTGILLLYLLYPLQVALFYLTVGSPKVFASKT